MFFHMITGSPPYESNNAMALLMKHVADPIPQLSAALPGLPAGLQKVIERGMAKLPSDRYTTAGEMAKAVDQALSTAPEPAKPEKTGVWGSASAAAPATESSSPVSFDALRSAKSAAPARGDDMPTRMDSFTPGKMPGAGAPAYPDPNANSEATNALDFRAIPTERRRLEWTPQADSTPPPPAGVPRPPPRHSPRRNPRPPPTPSRPNRSRRRLPESRS